MKENNKMFFFLIRLSIMCNIISGTGFKPSRSTTASDGSIIISKFLPQLSRNSASDSSRPCTSPSPASIAPCECREDYIQGRGLFCLFEFEDEDVTEMTHNLFKNFNASNNKFDFAWFAFVYGYTSNFMFDYATSGHLEIKVFVVGDIFFGINVENGMLPMSESAILGSINSLSEIVIVNLVEVYPKLAFPENFLFSLGLSNLKLLCLIGFDKFHIPEETAYMLESLIIDMNLEALPKMLNLKKLSFLSDETSLSSDVLKKVPNLEYLIMSANLKPILPSTFEGSNFLEFIDLSETNVGSIDLTGLGPSTFVALPNTITKLPEQNFRQFLEGAMRKYISVAQITSLSGGIYLGNSALECSCDFKWLCEVPYATDLLYDAECADGTSLESAMEVICNQC